MLKISYCLCCRTAIFCAMCGFSAVSITRCVVVVGILAPSVVMRSSFNLIAGIVRTGSALARRAVHLPVAEAMTRHADTKTMNSIRNRKSSVVTDKIHAVIAPVNIIFFALLDKIGIQHINKIRRLHLRLGESFEIVFTLFLAHIVTLIYALGVTGKAVTKTGFVFCLNRCIADIQGFCNIISIIKTKQLY